MVREVRMSDEHDDLSPARPRHDLVRDADAEVAPQRRSIFEGTVIKRHVGCDVSMRDWRRLRAKLAREKVSIADYFRRLVQQTISDEPDPVEEGGS